LIDTHIDLPVQIRYHFEDNLDTFDYFSPKATRQVDLPRLRRGGVSGFFSIAWVDRKKAYDLSSLWSSSCAKPNQRRQRRWIRRAGAQTTFRRSPLVAEAALPFTTSAVTLPVRTSQKSHPVPISQTQPMTSEILWNRSIPPMSWYLGTQRT